MEWESEAPTISSPSYKYKGPQLAMDLDNDIESQYESRRWDPGADQSTRTVRELADVRTGVPQLRHASSATTAIKGFRRRQTAIDTKLPFIEIRW